MSFFSTTMIFGTPVDITLAELAVESFFPADAITVERLQRMSGGLNSDMWQYQTVEFAEHGLRCITYDRRGHGRSDQPSDGYDVDTLADDLAVVTDSLDVSNATLIGHSRRCAPDGEPTFRSGWPTTHRRSSPKMIPSCTFKIYEGAPHGLFLTHKERLNADVLQFMGV